MADWREWHAAYDDPASSLSRRLDVVRRRLADAVDAAPPGRVTVLSLCGGEARDVAALAQHPRRADVRARVVERDPRNAATARALLAPLDAEVAVADAGLSDAALGGVPADVLLLCGIFGNVPDADVERTVRFAPRLCAPGATLLWTRHRMPPDLTPALRGWVADSGFAEVAFDCADDVSYGVGTARLVAEPPPFEPGVRLFSFA